MHKTAYRQLDGDSMLAEKSSLTLLYNASNTTYKEVVKPAFVAALVAFIIQSQLFPVTLTLDFGLRALGVVVVSLLVAFSAGLCIVPLLFAYYWLER
jgi:hypothetical protein